MSKVQYGGTNDDVAANYSGLLYIKLWFDSRTVKRDLFKKDHAILYQIKYDIKYIVTMSHFSDTECQILLKVRVVREIVLQIVLTTVYFNWHSVY